MRPNHPHAARSRGRIIAPLALLAAFGPAPAAQPETRPIVTRAPHRPVEQVRTTGLHIHTAIADGVATTELDATLRNDGGRDAEAQFVLPLPRGATADGFTMTVAGQEMAGEVLDAGRARGIYEEIVRRRRDPGLLEYFGNGCLRARVFPIPPQQDVQVKVRYRQLVAETGGLYEWSFPLRAIAATGLRPERLGFDVAIHSSKRLGNVLSPLGGIEIVRSSDHDAKGSLEWASGQTPDRDLLVQYSLTDKEFGLTLLTYRRPGEAGYYLMMLSPKRDWDSGAKTRKFVQFVLDTSGSMQGRKIEQAKAALRFFVNSLAAHDRFNIIPFATEAAPFFEFAPEANATALETALAKIDRIEARGGTNIEDALRRALATAVDAGGSVPLDVLPIVVFLTDGEPTVGQTNRERLLELAKQCNVGRHRLFVFGVGDQVNAKLLDQLADDNGGARDYVREDENIELKTGALLTKLSHPVLTDVTLHIDGLDTSEQMPRRLRDMFKGSQLVTVGRYHGSGHHAIRLGGVIGGSRREYVYEGSFPVESTRHDFVATLWAEQRVAELLDAIRINGQKRELLEEVQRLAKEFGIVTPFTSHLIVEEGMRLAGDDGVRRGGRFRGPGDTALRVGAGGSPGSAGPAAPSAGAGQPGPGGPATPAGPATPGPDREAEARLRRLGRAEAGADAVAESKATRADDFSIGGGRKQRDAGPIATRRAAGRTFFGIGDRWIDGSCPKDWEKQARKVEAFSADYFALLAAHADLKDVFALGTAVVVKIGDEIVEIVPAPAAK